MEAVPRLPMISFDLKVTMDNAEFGPSLKAYIRDFYNEDPESYSNEIHQLESLRGAAVRPTRDVAGCAIMKRYYCQLQFLQSRFPMEKDGAAAVMFTWREVHSSIVCSWADIRFEMAAILYNIGALHTQLGSRDPRDSPDGMKMACTHFQCAAWVFQQLKDPFPQNPGLESTPDLMEFLYRISLAQAQECILEKSMIDNRKPIIIAKVASAVVKYYHVASIILHRTCGGEIIMAETVGSKMVKVWKRYTKFKRVYYTSVCSLFLGQQSEEQQKMGERVAYYNTAYEMLEQAMKIAKSFDKNEMKISAVTEALTFTMDVVEGKRKAAKNENEFIYHEAVPDKDQLEKVFGVSLVKGIPFSANDADVSGPDIFARLVPMKAHTISSLYSEEKAKLLRDIGGKIEKSDQELVEYMLNLQLDYLYSHKSHELPFPEEIVERCAAMAVKTSEVENLEIELNKLSQIYQDVTNMLREIDNALQEEEAREKEYQLVMGPRPPSIVATDMTREAQKYQEANEKATQSTEKLNVAVKGYIANLRLLSSGLEELAKVIPAPAPVTDPGEEAVIERMQQLKEKVDEMRQQRIMLANQLRESVCQDDITGQLVTRQAENYEVIFAEELKKHQQYVSLIEKNLGAQDKILTAVTDAYANYSVIQRKYSKALQKRSAAIKNLIMSFDSLDEISSKIDKGMKFYSALEANVSKLLSRIRSTCKVQQEEREQILAKNKISLPSKTPAPSRSNDAPQAPKLKDYLDNAKKDAAVPGMTGYSTLNQQDPTAYYQSYNQSAPSVMPTSGQDMAGVTANMANLNVGAKNYPPWIPGVRPAPVGSESTNPAEGKNETQPQTSTQGVPPTSSSYPYYATGYTSTGYSDGGYSADAGYSTGANYGAGSGYSGYPQQVSTQQTYGGYGYSGVPWNYNTQRGSAGDLDVSGIDFPSENSLASGASSVCSGVSSAYSSAPVKTSEPTQTANMQPNYADPNYRYDPNGTSYGYNGPYGAANVASTAATTATTMTVDNNCAYSTSSTGATGASKNYGLSSSDTSAISEQVAAALAYKHSLGNNFTDPLKYNLPGTTPGGFSLPGQGIGGAASSLTAGLGGSLCTPPLPSSLLGQPGSAAAAAAAAAASLYNSPGLSSTQGLNSNYSQALAEASKYIQSTVGSCPLTSASVAAQAGRMSAPTLPTPFGAGMGTDFSRGPPFLPPSAMTSPTVLSALNSLSSQAGPTNPLLNNSPAAAAIANFKNFQSTFPNVSVGQTGLPFGFPTTQSGANPFGHTMTPSFLAGLGQSALNGMQPPSSLLGGSQLPFPLPSSLSSTTGASMLPGGMHYPYMNNPNASYYSNAGSFLTNQTSSSHGSGLTSDATGAHIPSSIPGYFQSQYGLQFSNPGNGSGSGSGTNATDYIPSSDNYVFSTSAQNTYMQARMPNSNPSTTYSMNQTSPTAVPTTEPPATTTAAPTGTGTERSTPASNPEPSSNMDLLAGLDFTMTSNQFLDPQQNNWNDATGMEANNASPVKSRAAQTVSGSTNEQGTSTIVPSQAVTQTSTNVSRRPSTSMAQVAADQMRMLQIPSEGDRPGGQAKPAAKDPFQDTEALNQFTQEVEKYEKFVEGLTTKTLNGPTPLDLKWKELLELQERDIHKRSISVARCYPMKNRFPDILPYDCSRVELPSTKDDYINASYMKDLTPLTPAFIVTQAPLPSTYADFWTMVWEKQVEVIVCLLSDAELNGELYWPSEKGQEMPMGRMKLSLQTCIVRQYWAERIISICEPESRATRVVIHLQFTAWPGSSFPASPGPFLTFVSECLTFHAQQRSAVHPIAVHCLSGVGRTGLFCLLAAAICEIQAGHGLIDLVKLSAAMSERRKNALRDREHLKFAYQSLLYHAQDLLLKRGILTSGSTFEDKRSRTGGKCHTRHPSEDFLLGPPAGLSQLQSGIEKMGLDAANKTEPTVTLSLDKGDCVTIASCTSVDVVTVSPTPSPVVSFPQSPSISSLHSGTPLSSSQCSSGRTSPLHQSPTPHSHPSHSLHLSGSSHLTDLSQLGQQVRAKEKKTPRFTAESFKKSTVSIESQPNSDDPFSQLDPLWPLKRP